jgi:hypothetical protein
MVHENCIDLVLSLYNTLEKTSADRMLNFSPSNSDILSICAHAQTLRARVLMAFIRNLVHFASLERLMLSICAVQGAGDLMVPTSH